MYIRSYPTYEEWKHNISLWVVFASDLVLILPMRNGNQHLFCLVFQIRNLSSYPTYEEWKPRIIEEISIGSFCSYPTYEEWKLYKHAHQRWSTCMFLSYLWGMETFDKTVTVKKDETFLSYLWGMETSWQSRRYCRSCMLVLILPMRNGNHRIQWQILKPL